MFSKACEYGIRAVIFITEQSMNGKKVSLKDTTKAIDSPESYTSKILQQLKKHEIIISEKGPKGGFSINHDQLDTLTLQTLVFIFDGNKIYEGCALGLRECNSKKPCPIHNEFALVRDSFKKMITSTSIKSLAHELNGKSFFLRA